MATVATEAVKEAGAVRDAERPEPYRMTTEVYERIVEAGVFGDRSPIYLWNGQLVLPMTKGPSHNYSLNALHHIFVRLLPEGWNVRQENPVRLGNDSEPEPDLTVLRGSSRDYKSRHPAPGDVALTIEDAESSRRFDQGEKLRAYAAEAIPVSWVVNIPEACVDVYTKPTGPAETPGYGGHLRFNPGGEVPVVLDGREVGRVAVDDVLP